MCGSLEALPKSGFHEVGLVRGDPSIDTLCLTDMEGRPTSFQKKKRRKSIKLLFFPWRLSLQPVEWHALGPLIQWTNFRLGKDIGGSLRRVGLLSGGGVW